MDNKKGLIWIGAIFLLTLVIYFTKLGRENYVLITDLLAVVYSAIAIIFGLYAIKIYSLKSLQGKTLFLITLGIGSWFLAELIWFIFSYSVRYYSEFFRFLGYLPLVIAFFIFLKLSNPEIRKSSKKLFCIFLIFLAFTVLYLNIVPVIFGNVSLLDSILTGGYVIADFVLLFGIALLIKTSYDFGEGSMSQGWFIMAFAFISIFIFDVYFAFNSQDYYSGDLIEIFWLSSYLLVSYGFLYHRNAMRNFLGGIQVEDKKTKGKHFEEEYMFLKDNLNVILISFFVGVLLSLMFFFTFYQEPEVNQEKEYVLQYQSYDNFTFEYREDFFAVFNEDIIDELNGEFSKSDKEYLFCLLGDRSGNNFFINELFQPELFYQGDIVISLDDPSCQIPGSLGSIHSHPRGSCIPSNNDLFAWGEMKDPEPKINAIQCGVNEFYIMLMPEEHEPLDFRSLMTEIKG